MVVAFALLTVSAPFPALLSILIRTDGGRLFFAHRRIGANGRPFRCLKFRTMVADAGRVLDDHLAADLVAAAEWAATRKLVNDPRVTGFRLFLRRTSLDELPRLINVLRLPAIIKGYVAR